ncbi:MAG: O-antigen ligase family protein [Candidatus Saccharicenans sp.]|uniref:O-antigen ligase family protein n=1 Tax=Candidatus Saccharicenans sp. TaxID=2819258 RepID=UPI00404A3DAD
MSPIIALLFFSGLIAIFLIIDYKKSDNITHAIWIPALWLLHSQSKGIGYYLNISSTMEEGSAPDRYFLIVLAISGLFILKKRNFHWRALFKNNYLFLLIITYILLSTAWANYPNLTIRRGIKELVVIIIAGIIISENNPKLALFNAFRKSLYISIPISFMLIKYFPEYGRQYGIHDGKLMWIGIAGQKNDLAIICSFASIFLFWSIWNRITDFSEIRKKLLFLIDLFILLLSIYLMMGPERTLTYSATSYIVLLIGLIAIFAIKFFVKKGRENKILISLLLISIILFGTAVPFIRSIPGKEIITTLKRDQTLTGRTVIWDILKPYAYDKFFLGYSYGEFWTTHFRDSNIRSAHNGYLDTILNAGIVGLLMYALFYIFLGISTNKSIISIKDENILILAMLFIFLIHNISESTLPYFHAFPTSLITLSAFIINDNMSKK